MVKALELEMANRFADVAARSLVQELGVEGSYVQIVRLLSEADEDMRQMYEDILAALTAMRNECRRPVAG